MKYLLGKKEFKIKIDQDVVNENEISTNHKDLIGNKQSWYSKGYTSVSLPDAFFFEIRTKTIAYIKKAIQEALNIDMQSIDKYHRLVQNNEQHINVLSQIGKLIDPSKLGIDIVLLEKEIKKKCGINIELSCRDVSDIRIFRPYTGGKMDNNPLHRDTWLPILNNCINVYIPIIGNTRFSSLCIVPGSHLWNTGEVERTVTNAKIEGVQYGLPSVTTIKRKYNILRPKLSHEEVLLFSPNIIHGGAVNLNKDVTRVSIEIRFWPKVQNMTI
jgi:ectoine hydroxylase-related dioxygenase (phytanoyl-CoA dioxygenase family)